MPAKPDAFLGYTRFDDEDGEISAFRLRLSRTVRQVSGEHFNIFQDVDDETGIGLGERWKDKLDEMLDQARFFIPILTPSFFRSEPCRQELRTFLDLEHKVGRRDLVLPIYWITCPVLEEVHLKAKDELAQEIDERQRWDWRELIFEDLMSPTCRRGLHVLSTQIEKARRNVLSRIEARDPAGVGDRSTTKPPQSKPAVTIGAETVRSDIVSALDMLERGSTSRTQSEVFRDIDETWCPEMVRIPAGLFLMGSPANEKGRRPNEGPQHEVWISHHFALGRYPVTFIEYDHFCEQTGKTKPSDAGWGRGSRPVIHVNYSDATAYCSWLSDMTGKTYRLPTEAEWEYACRAGASTAYTSGRYITKGQANFGRYVNMTSAVGDFPANSWGLCDMTGNVWEWCVDRMRRYSEASVIDPMGEGEELKPALRGGAWINSERSLRCAARGSSAVHTKSHSFGFRCARVSV